MIPSTNEDIYLVSGGHGFIGSHVARSIANLGYKVRIADKAPKSCIEFSDAIWDVQIGNLCDPDFCQVIIRNITVVLHFAANMGGMGTIHDANDFQIYQENHCMTQNLLFAAANGNVRLFFFASSACVYPISIQGDTAKDVALREDFVFQDGRPDPQGLYGREKLCSELLVQGMTSHFDIRIARFHNVYGPGGCWNDGREKVPAALLRKAFALQYLPAEEKTLEIWGDGRQRRSFLYIDDCVRAVLALLKSSCSEPLNIGSSEAVSVKELADLALDLAGESLRTTITIDVTKPIGVASRNSHNKKVDVQLGWCPKVSLRQGMQITAEWLQLQMKHMMSGSRGASRIAMARSLLPGRVLQLEDEHVTFAILLPVTSRGLPTPQECLSNLRIFAKSLRETTWRDTHSLGGSKFRYRVYISIDADDSFLWGAKKGENNRVADVLRQEGVSNVRTLSPARHPPGHICAHWRTSSRQAWEDGCHYFLLAGDDVTFLNNGWMSTAYDVFCRRRNEGEKPAHFGCVAFKDISFPGMPTFPVVGRAHLDIFHGDILPPCFVNQDGDPFLFQLYRRFGASSAIDCQLTNATGGSGEARYKKQHSSNWSFTPLDDATTHVEDWLISNHYTSGRLLTIDVIIPSFRVPCKLIDKILALKSSPTSSLSFIIIVDNPKCGNTKHLLEQHENRMDVRIRINSTNLGASASRNLGLAESAADYVHFLDDDVVPCDDMIFELERAIRENPTAAGLIPLITFPPADTIFKSAVHLSGVTYFWSICQRLPIADIPWGVTASLAVRRSVGPECTFNTNFPKTGGGEDIDFCCKKRDASEAVGGGGFVPAPSVLAIHPWWSDGARRYHRFFMWSFGDGMLIKLYPESTYVDFAPNSAELILLCCSLLVLSIPLQMFSLRPLYPLVTRAIVSIVVSNVTYDIYHHYCLQPALLAEHTKHLSPAWIIFAIVESTFIRVYSELGRTWGLAYRMELWGQLGRRFDWFMGRLGGSNRRAERRASVLRLFLCVIIFTCI